MLCTGFSMLISTFLLLFPSTSTREKEKYLHIFLKIYIFSFLNNDGFKNLASTISNDSGLCFRVSFTFGMVWFIFLTRGMLSTVQLLLHPNVTHCIHHILQPPNAMRRKQYRSE